MDGLTASMNPAGQPRGAQLSNHQPETGAEWKDAFRSLVFYVARNPSCRLSHDTSIHANALRRRTVLCTGCNTSIYPTGRRWKPISQLSLVCDTKRTMLMHLLSHNMARRSTTTTLNIGPPLLDLRFGFLLDASVHFAVKFMLFSICNIPTDQPAVRRELCSGCLSLKKRKHFHINCSTATLTPIAGYRPMNWPADVGSD
jgi:hypothetical protein